VFSGQQLLLSIDFVSQLRFYSKHVVPRLDTSLFSASKRRYGHVLSVIIIAACSHTLHSHQTKKNPKAIFEIHTGRLIVVISHQKATRSVFGCIVGALMIALVAF
jgi:hypothetical protein